MEREAKEALATIKSMRRFIDQAITTPVGKALVAKHFGQEGAEIPAYLDRNAVKNLTKQLEAPEEKGSRKPLSEDANPATGTDTATGEDGSSLDDNEDFLASLED